MPRGSFGRSVARAAASGGGRAYRARRPIGWYFAISFILVAGIGLTVYSRTERIDAQNAATGGPTATSNWHVAIGIDICGKMQPNLPANSNVALVGIRTFGDGLIDIDPGAVSNASTYEGAKATLGLFFNSYPQLLVTSTAIHMPGKGAPSLKNNQTCTSKLGPDKGKATVQIKYWSSPSDSGKLVSSNPSALHLRDGQMVTLAFVPKGAAIPEPPSKQALLQALGQVTSTSATTTTTQPATTTTKANSTTTTTTKK